MAFCDQSHDSRVRATARPSPASADRRPVAAASESDAILRQIPLRQHWAYVASIALTLLLFVVDSSLPRGATAAIGYCLVPVLAAGTRRRDFLLGMTIAGTLLTWASFLLEPSGALAWMSAFDRAMVTAVLWVIFFLVARRAQAVTALARQSRALEATKRELERSNAELEGFASVVAHDIRGPLNTIGLLAQLLDAGLSAKPDAETSQYLTDINNEVNSLSSLIQNVLSYARVGSGEVRLADCDVDAALSSVRLKLKSEQDRHGAAITNDPLPTIPADPTLIEQLLQNLVENSIKYRSEAPPRVHVSATQNDSGWQFCVRDNGIGINANDVQRIFQPFHQLHGSKTRRGGVGLGLATCKRIVERHGGRIEVSSTRGEGSTFVFTIPLSPGPAVRAHESSAR
jgi:signal transduction histidine kinase